MVPHSCLPSNHLTRDSGSLTRRTTSTNSSGPSDVPMRTLLPQQRIEPENSKPHAPKLWRPEPDYRQPWRPEIRQGGSTIALAASPIRSAPKEVHRFASANRSSTGGVYETVVSGPRGAHSVVPHHLAALRAAAVDAGVLSRDCTLIEYLGGVTVIPPATEREVRDIVRCGAVARDEAVVEKRRSTRNPAVMVPKRSERAVAVRDGGGTVVPPPHVASVPRQRRSRRDTVREDRLAPEEEPLMSGALPAPSQRSGSSALPASGAPRFAALRHRTGISRTSAAQVARLCGRIIRAAAAFERLGIERAAVAPLPA